MGCAGWKSKIQSKSDCRKEEWEARWPTKGEKVTEKSSNVICYARVSTLEQAEKNNSLSVQEGKFKEFCSRNNFESLETFTDKQSARTVAKRPEFQRMMEFCKKNHKKLSAVIVADLSRFARNVADQGVAIATLSQLGIEVMSIDEPITGDTAAGKLSRNIIGSMSQFFSDSLSEKTKDRMRAAVKSGRFLWVCPVGYLNQKNGSASIIKPDPERAALVRKGFELMATGGYSADDALRTVTALGLTTRKNRPVPRQTWHAILRNPLYAGWVRSGDLLVRGVHQPIVPQQLFDCVQEVLAGRSKTAQPRQSVHPEFSLRQFVRCAKCDRGLTAGIIKKKFAYYWCYTKGCRDVLVRKEELEKHFVRLLGSYQPTIEYLERLPEIAKRQWAEREARIRQDSKALKIRLEEIRRLNSAAIKAKLTGELTAEDFDTVKTMNTADAAGIEQQLNTLESEKNMMQELIEQSQRELVDLVSAWRKAGISGRTELQIGLFPDGLVWSHEGGFLNSKNVGLMHDWHEFFQSLGDSRTMLNDFFALFGVPDGI
jgi:site-specific DNA recombinase